MKRSRAMSVLGNILFYTIALVVILLLILIGISLFTPAEFPRISCTMYYNIVGFYNRIDNPLLTEWSRIKGFIVSFSRVVCKPRLIHYGVPGTEWYERKKWCIDIRNHLTEEGWNYFRERGYLPESCDELKEFLEENWNNRRKYFLFLANFLVAKNIKIAYEEIGRDYGSLFDKDPILRIVCISYPGKKLVNATKFPDENPDYALFIRIPGKGTNTSIDSDISVKNILNYFRSNPFKQTTGEEYIWAILRDWNYKYIGDYVFRWCPIRYWERYRNNITYYDCSNSPHARWLANLLDKISVCVLIGVDFWDDSEGDNKNNVIVTKGSIVTYPYPELFYEYYENPWSALDRSNTYLEEVYRIRIYSYGEWLHLFVDESFDYFVNLPEELVADNDHTWEYFAYKIDSDEIVIDPYLNFYAPIPKYLRLYNHLLRVLLTKVYQPVRCNGSVYNILNESLTDPNNPPERRYEVFEPGSDFIHPYFYNSSSNTRYNYIPYRSFSECPFLNAPKFFKDVKVPLSGTLPNLTVEDNKESVSVIEEVCEMDCMSFENYDECVDICKLFYKEIIGYIVPATNDIGYYIVRLPENFDSSYFYQSVSDFAIEPSYTYPLFYRVFFIDREREIPPGLLHPAKLYYKLGSNEYSVKVPLILEPNLYIISNFYFMGGIIANTICKKDYEDLETVVSMVKGEHVQIIVEFDMRQKTDRGEYYYNFTNYERVRSGPSYGQKPYILKMGEKAYYAFILG